MDVSDWQREKETEAWANYLNVHLSHIKCQGEKDGFDLRQSEVDMP